MLKEKAEQVVTELAQKIISSIGPSKLVVGLSGGADSTLVLLIAKRVTELDSRYKALAVHCIHGLDADDPVWFNHCHKLCKTVGVEIKTPKLNIVYGNGRSPEEVSRAERYRALLSNLDEHSALLLGHQADDQIESFLLALKRGSGPYGLSGMRYLVKDDRGTLIRPLLELHKTEIIEIIESLGFTHVFDISNTYMKFERNFIRLKVLPLLRERFPGIDKSIIRSSKLCASEHELAMRYARETYDRAFDRERLRLDISKLNVDDDPLMMSVLRLFLYEKLVMTPEYSSVLDAVNLCRISPDQSTVIPLDDGYEVRRFRNYLYIIRPAVCNAHGQYELEAGRSLHLDDYIYSLVPSEDGFACDRVILDFDYSGSLKLHPVKRVHSREIKKLFTEYGVPSWERDSVCLVRSKVSGNILALGSVFVTKDGQQEAQSGIRYRLKIERV